MDEILTLIIPITVSAVTSFLVAKFYGERWVEARRSRREHSIVLKDEFFKVWLEKISAFNVDYCKIDAQYSTKRNRMVALQPSEPDNLKFYSEAMNHLKNYATFLADWRRLKETTLELNEVLAVLFEEIRVLVASEIALPYWCPRIEAYSGDKPNEYLCPDLFIRAIYDELFWRMEARRKRYFGNGVITPFDAEGKKFYRLEHSYNELACSANEELMKKAQQLFGKFVEDEEFLGKIQNFINKKRNTYDKELDVVKQNISDIIKSVELGNVMKGKCRYCP